MKFLTLLLSLIVLSCTGTEQPQRYLFFLHNMFLEVQPIDSSHPQYGKVEYRQIVDQFAKNGFTVFSEIRPKGTKAEEYARTVVRQIDSLINLGVKPSEITVAGTSKGGYIAMYTSSYLKNKDVNFVFIGCCDEKELSANPEIQWYGNVLNIYERTDTFGSSCMKFKDRFRDNLGKYQEIELNTGLKHGFLYKALPDWTEPSIAWAKNAPIERPALTVLIDSVLSDTIGQEPFNGIVLVTQGNRTLYGKTAGYADIDNRTPLNLTDQVVIGSLSKQITAVLVLREYEQGRLSLHEPIGTYLSDLSQPWKDSVTVSHLLSHTHGIVSLTEPLKFSPGTQFEYGNLGIELAGRIAERTSGKSLAQLSREVFDIAGMIHSTYPGLERDTHRAKAQTRTAQGGIAYEKDMASSVAAGRFISTAPDLTAWNAALHHGKLMADSTYKLMTTKKPNAIRPHPAVGLMDYGYGISMDENKIGHTGFAPGYVSINFYFPKSETSVVVLENLAVADFKKAYEYHVRVLRTVEQHMSH
jgi:CubicO group peptidase (beta-lactamase class C family)